VKLSDDMARFAATTIFIIFLTIACSCAAPAQQATVNTPGGKETTYPPSYEMSPGRRQEVLDAWKNFLAESGLPFSPLELDPVLNTPRSLPVDVSGRINLAIGKKNGTIGEMEAKEAVRNFIERTRGILSGNPKNGIQGVKDLSLVSFTPNGNSYKFSYQQASYPFSLASGYGELKVMIDKSGNLLAWSSSLVPKLELPTSPSVNTEEFYKELLNRELSYTTIAGKLQTYKITKRGQIVVKEPVIFPKRQGNKLTLHLAYPVDVGNGMTWTYYFDAIDGEELGVNQNFAS
jgi:hypothetical protein